MKIKSVCSALGLVLMFGGGCAVDTAGIEEGESGVESATAADAAETVGATEQAVGPRRLHSSTERYFGGDLFRKDHWITVGGLCRAGYERSRPTPTNPAPNPKVRWNDSPATTGGNCNFEAWLAPEDPFDCRARIHAYTEAFGGQGTCYIDLYEERSTQSCVRRTPEGLERACGGMNFDGTCFCDPSCELYGDCCGDYARICAGR